MQVKSRADHDAHLLFCFFLYLLKSLFPSCAPGEGHGGPHHHDAAGAAGEHREDGQLAAVEAHHRADRHVCLHRPDECALALGAVTSTSGTADFAV